MNRLRQIMTVWAGLTLGITGLAGCAAQPVMEILADYPTYPSLEAVSKASDIVVTGTLTGSHEIIEYPDTNSDDPRVNPQAGVELSEAERAAWGVPTTLSAVRVETVLKGDLRPGETITINQLGGTMNGYRYREPSTVLLPEAGAQKFVLIASRNPDGSYYLSDPVLGPLSLTGDSLGFLQPDRVDARSAQTTTLAQLAELVRQ